ncbi:3'-phosphoadenoside 5'-phosphosulfate metabolism (CysQ) [Serinicoccus hydrothermalis]|uniref:3'(2'),5-bisphosphonucleoside 3'(2')-phosphohydrolase n=1 Tax=Serinicoccus hydrothermalis TaxID=1758689 RepID=A0A1B1NEL4_9MICO|nr:3'(2'),5'-bisphosphate nucleotidase CysQ [Serinicoccus hydrothermalis]ANS79795.1 3'-phosphoadenoside 5'-phosphosulfate metabolism (CysQ) [Serinicoccus hydrothermalis]
MTDDHQLARELADLAGERLLAVRAELHEAGIEGRELKDAGDIASQEVLADALRERVPDDAVLSEEATDDHERLSSQRVWIIDPLDGTREFSEVPRDDWAVHVALWQDGELVAGAVALPARGVTYGTDASGRAGIPARPDGDPPLRLAVSRSRPPAFAEELGRTMGATTVPMGSAGVKAMSVVDGSSDAYVHAGGQYEWDSAAPVAVAAAYGLHTSRVDGSPLVYNKENPWSPDLVVCRPEVAESLLAALATMDLG